ncbi:MULTISPECIES: hypothetical protein [Streptosporangium]|uniref:Uncharacterized protein n=1 Tax=Streptosporangium brasiliense TaxID=47480 RepID=A0ABT9RGZ3_9ACTN|nr:hypothetical protein [Streptosporangium brasiliense]MDP9868132.1 hypothetical protein [Streptosporangium brasiliense]
MPATGLSVEHFKKYGVEWSGERGRTTFFRNELPYDPPDQAAFMNGNIKGWAACKVADSVNVHEGWGLGSYCVFTSDPTIEVDHGFEVPVKPGVRFHSLLVVSLGGKGRYDHVVNDTGAPAYGTGTIPSTVTSCP